MDRATQVFWALIFVLLGAASYWGVRAEKDRRAVQRAEGTVASGDLVSLSTIVDGDTIVARTDGGDNVAIRIIGIKAFDPIGGKDPMGQHAQAAISAVQRLTENKPVRVELGQPSHDKYGRTLAVLFIDEIDIGLELVKDGVVMVYTPFPFPQMKEYLQEQEKARANRKGLWSDPVAVGRADALHHQWSKGAH